MTPFEHAAENGRLPWPVPGDLDAERLALYESITGGPRASAKRAFPMSDEEGRLHGPFNAMLMSPAVGSPTQELGAAIRYRTTFTDRGREIAILVLAAYRESEFEWYAHERVGRLSGLDDDALSALKNLTGPAASFDAYESMVYETTLVLLSEGDLDDGAFARASVALGIQQLHELVTLVGYYDLLALSLRVWRTRLPEDG